MPCRTPGVTFRWAAVLKRRIVGENLEIELKDSLGAPLGPFQLNDAFGHRNAAESGVCAMLDADSCDDNNACTRDDCDAKLGCIHTPIPEGGSCTANGAVCKAGVCVK